MWDQNIADVVFILVYGVTGDENMELIAEIVKYLDFFDFLNL